MAFPSIRGRIGLGNPLCLTDSQRPRHHFNVALGKFDGTAEFRLPHRSFYDGYSPSGRPVASTYFYRQRYQGKSSFAHSFKVGQMLNEWYTPA